VKGTQLWQEAGSPIIRGRSRRARPFWQPWLAASALAVVALAAALAPRVIGQASQSTAQLAGSALIGAGAIPGALVGAAVGVWIARSAGWRAAWAYGVIGGVVLGGLSAWLLGGTLTG